MDSIARYVWAKIRRIATGQGLSGQKRSSVGGEQVLHEWKYSEIKQQIDQLTSRRRIASMSWISKVLVRFISRTMSSADRGAPDAVESLKCSEGRHVCVVDLSYHVE